MRLRLPKKTRYSWRTRITVQWFLVLAGIVASAPLLHASERMPVWVSILPQKYFVQQIGKDRVDVQVMVAPGASPYTYEPKPRQMVDLSKSRIYFAMGLPIERTWLKKIAATNPQMLLVHTDRGIQKIPKQPAFDLLENHHDHGLDYDHGPEGLDPHIWLSPPLVMMQARTILTALQLMDPAHHDVYETNYQAFVHEIIQLDRRLRKVFAGAKGATFLVFHPCWGYFAHTYGLKQLPIELEGKAPEPAQLAVLVQKGRQMNARAIFAQLPFSTKIARQLAHAMDARLLFVDPLAENWTQNLQQVAQQLKDVIE